MWWWLDGLTLNGNQSEHTWTDSQWLLSLKAKYSTVLEKENYTWWEIYLQCLGIMILTCFNRTIRISYSWTCNEKSTGGARINDSKERTQTVTRDLYLIEHCRERDGHNKEDTHQFKKKTKHPTLLESTDGERKMPPTGKFYYKPHRKYVKRTKV